jgi:hypothetical protein
VGIEEGIGKQTEDQRNQLGTALDYFDADNRNSSAAWGQRQVRQEADDRTSCHIMPDNRLFLQIGDERIECGLPQTAHDDFAVGAHVPRWHYPDIIA